MKTTQDILEYFFDPSSSESSGIVLAMKNQWETKTFKVIFLNRFFVFINVWVLLKYFVLIWSRSSLQPSEEQF